MLERTLTPILRGRAEAFPAVFLTGPRQSGKTTLVRATFPDFRYVSLENLQVRAEATEDPLGFLERLEGLPGVILDEAQRAPDLFSYLQQFLDERRSGPVVLTGSQNFLLLERISQSLAGRVAVLELWPMSLAEAAGRAAVSPEGWHAPRTPEAASDGGGLRALDEALFRGGYPRVVADHLDPVVWLDAYVATYLERDVRSVTNVGDLDAFRRFLGLLAGRAGQLLNLSSLGADAGVSQPTARRWLSILEASYVVMQLRPHHTNFGKRLVKSPKIYFVDTGLLCRLLGVRAPDELATHPLRGSLVENLVVSEVYKLFIHHGQRSRVWFWRDRQGHEVDLVWEEALDLLPIEVKAGVTVASDAMAGLDRFCKLSGSPGGVLIYGGSEEYRRGPHLLRPWGHIT